MYREAKLFQELLGKEFRDGCDVRTGAFVALERWLVWSVEDEDGMNIECDQAKEAVVEGAKSRIRATCSTSVSSRS